MLFLKEASLLFFIYGLCKGLIERVREWTGIIKNKGTDKSIGCRSGMDLWRSVRYSSGSDILKDSTTKPLSATIITNNDNELFFQVYFTIIYDIILYTLAMT